MAADDYSGKAINALCLDFEKSDITEDSGNGSRMAINELLPIDMGLFHPFEIVLLLFHHAEHR